MVCEVQILPEYEAEVAEIRQTYPEATEGLCDLEVLGFYRWLLELGEAERTD